MALGGEEIEKTLADGAAFHGVGVVSCVNVEQ
jgi:hypothetical protein